MIQIAIIGMGQRGKATCERLQDIEAAHVAVTSDKDRDWHEVTSSSGIDLIFICTPWDCHVEIAVEAMRQGKNVAIEVPAAMTVSECRQLVSVAHATGRHCVMLENCCYDTWHLGIRAMVRQGLLGEITRLEGAYIHPVENEWMHRQRLEHKGNPYPTHGFGPMCQLLDADDRPEYLMSLSSENHLTGDHLNDSLIRTHKGVTMLLQYDIATPRPYNRLQTVCGTLGFAQKYPVPTISICSPDCKVNDASGLEHAPKVFLQGREAEELVEGYIPEEFKALIAEGRSRGVRNVMNYMMDRRLIDSLEQEKATGHTIRLDMEVSEAALWSCITELTEKSALEGGRRMEIELGISDE